MLPRATVLFVGPSQSGKSTTIGQLLALRDVVSKEELERATAAAQKYGRDNSFVFLVDAQSSERELGQTQHETYHKLTTQTHMLTVIDTPGHLKYIKNCVAGITQADIAVFVVSAVESELEASMPVITKQLGLVVLLGVKNLVFCLNKFDRVQDASERFRALNTKLTALAKSCGHKTVPQTVPVCSLYGDNLTNPSTNMPWYKGMSLISAICDCALPPRLNSKPLRMCIQQVKTIPGAGTVLIGQVGSGTLQAGTSVTISPAQILATVKSIQMYGEDLKTAEAWDNVGVCIEGPGVKSVLPGSLLSAEADPSKPVDRFVVQMMVREGAPKMLKEGYKGTIDVHCTHVVCKVHQLLYTIDKKTGKPAEVNPKFLKVGDVAWVELVPLAPISLETMADFSFLGRFMFRSGSSIVAVGAIKSITFA